MDHQLYMYSGVRERLLERHRFFVREIKSRVMSHFTDLEIEAQQFADREFQRLGAHFGAGEEDAGAELANNRGYEYFELLYDMKNDMQLSALAGMYHRWDKDLRDFIERELNHTVTADSSSEIAWDTDAIATFKLLKGFGWDCNNAPFFQPLQNCRLVVNVYKHGKGRSLTEVARLCPQYLGAEFPSGADSNPDHEDLTISPDQFDGFARAIENFWSSFPERLFHAG
jgi:hypothetical protein